MGSAQSLEQILIVTVFLLLYRNVLGQVGTPSVDPDEKNALYVLKSIFNNSILNERWKGDPCDLAYPWYGIQCSTKGHIIGIELNDMGLSWKVDVNEFMNFPELVILSFQNNSLWGNVMNFSFNHKMNIINLSGNKLDRPIPSSLLSLSVLESLQLQDNNLAVTIPEFNQSSILFFNVSNKNLTGSIPKTQTLQSFGSDSYSGNPGLYGPPLTATSRSLNGTGEPPSGNSPPNSHGDIFKNIFLVFVVILIVAVILLLIL